MNTPILQLREKKKDIVLILAIAIFLALAINFVTFFAAEKLANNSNIILYIGIIFFVFAFILLSRIILSGTDQFVRIQGVIAYKGKR